MADRSLPPLALSFTFQVLCGAANRSGLQRPWCVLTLKAPGETDIALRTNR